MKSNHTKGEWKVNGNIVFATKNERGSEPCICTCSDDNLDISYPEMEANAKLIAAAPELFTALKSCVLSMQAHPDFEPNSEFEAFVNQGWEAIKKAALPDGSN